MNDIGVWYEMIELFNAARDEQVIKIMEVFNVLII